VIDPRLGHLVTLHKSLCDQTQVTSDLVMGLLTYWSFFFLKKKIIIIIIKWAKRARVFLSFSRVPLGFNRKS